MGQTAAGRPGTGTATWVRSAFDALLDVSGVRRVGVALVEGGGRRLAFTANDRDHSEDIDWCAIDAYDDVPLNKAVRTGRLICGSVEELAARYPEFASRQGPSTRSVAAVPLPAAGQVMGGLVLYYDQAQPFSDAQLAELLLLGEELGAELREEQRVTPLAHRSLADEPVPDGALVAIHAVGPEPQGVATARRFVRDTLAGWHVDGDVVDATVLSVSELVTNAIIHTVAGCEVRLVLHEGILTLSVRDGGTGTGEVPDRAEDPLAEHGRGLQLVELISARWGSQLDAVGMTVWCELAVT
jgi:hypothetical protein